MNLGALSLTELAACVSEHLQKVPDVYTSSDVDFAVRTGIDRRAIRTALHEIGFSESGRIFVHRNAGVPWISWR